MRADTVTTTTFSLKIFSAPFSNMPPYMFNACVFCYVALDPNDIKVLCKERDEILCCNYKCCLAVGDEGYGVSFESNKAALASAGAGRSVGKCCKTSMYYCRLGCKYPETCCDGASHCLCIKRGHSLPFDDQNVKEPLCAICCVQCLPEVGIMQTAPDLPRMVR